MGECERVRAARQFAALGAAESAVRAVEEEVDEIGEAHGIEDSRRSPAALPPPGTYLVRGDRANRPCPFPCSVCRRKGRQE